MPRRRMGPVKSSATPRSRKYTVTSTARRCAATSRESAEHGARWLAPALPTAPGAPRTDLACAVDTGCGGAISLVEGIVAIVLVALLGLVLGVAQFDVLDHAAIVETISYGFILLIGAHLLYRAVRGDGHDHAHVPIAEMAGADLHDHHDH